MGFKLVHCRCQGMNSTTVTIVISIGLCTDRNLVHDNYETKSMYEKSVLGGLVVSPTLEQLKECFKSRPRLWASRGRGMINGFYARRVPSGRGTCIVRREDTTLSKGGLVSSVCVHVSVNNYDDDNNNNNSNNNNNNNNSINER
ncbi:hypothetical protein PoB_004993800 [Plakobranchus ocellatus]|uniref:Uncharacterized protein n=1 Tax=Plakobranchus ocellatus TaxID=259542 RepID=A0AAV4BW53_9GAST|nr:hypothetical protein PoB_004993800 [Plakobranchus ocellatus]